MSTIYWRAIGAAVGLMATTVLMVDGSTAQDQRPRNEIKNIGEHLLHWLGKNPEENTDIDRPCKNGEENRNSDLCAQWRAADAARESAEWAKQTYRLDVIGAVIGFFTLVSAAVAAFFAGSAAIYTKRSADEASRSAKFSEQANDLARNQSRAWLSISCRISKAHSGITIGGVAGTYWSVDCDCVNVGGTPALNVVFIAEISLLGPGYPSSVEQMNAFCDNIRNRNFANAEAVFPGRNGKFGHMVFLSNCKINEVLKDADFKAISPIVYGCISYRTLNDVTIRQTRFVYRVVQEVDGDAFALTPDSDDWLLRPVFLASPAVITAD